jgi:large subunit ribosomal protein L10
MDNPRPEKVAVVNEVRQHFEQSSAAILTEYRGLKVKDLAGLRRSLRSSGGEYKIYKNTLVRLAARESGLEALEEMLVGPTGITFIEGDAAAVAKVLRDYSRTNPLLLIKGGVLGEKIIGPQETTALAELPSREVLLAQLAGAIAAPMQQFAALLKALPQNLAYGLAALRDKKEAEGGSVAAAPPPTDAAGPEATEAAAEPADAAASESAQAATEPAETASEPAETASEPAETASEPADAAAEAVAGEQPADAAAGSEASPPESNRTAE